MWRLEVGAVMREMTLEEMAMVCGGADGLSPRQVDCLLGVANGLGSAQIEVWRVLHGQRDIPAWLAEPG